MRKQLQALAGNENFVACVVFAISFSVYSTTVCPTVSFTDSGELATVAATLGIAHPTGYPLWTLVSRIAAMIPVGSEPIIRLNIFACILTALAIAMFFKLVLVLLRSLRTFRFKHTDLRADHHLFCVLSGFVSSLTIGFSSTVWAQSTDTEVYALHALLVVITMYYFVSGIEEQLTRPENVSQRLLLFSFCLGLSFTNHMTTILLAPGFLYLFFATVGFDRNAWRLVKLFVPFFLVGLSVYCYLPIRSGAGPLLDWGHPVTLERILWHLTGKQYQVWMFSGSDVVKKQLNYFLRNFPTEFCWIVIPLIIVGVVETIVESRRFLTFAGLLFAGCVSYAVNYDIHDVDSYFLLAYIASGCILGVGVKRFVRWSSSFSLRLRYALPAGILVTMVLPLGQVSLNRLDVDQSKNEQVASFVHNAYSQLEPNAIIFASTWDYLVSPSYYYQAVRKERPDVVIIDEELLKNRTWYPEQLNREYPGILHGLETEVDAFLVQLKKFEAGESFDFNVIERCWNDLLEVFVAKAIRQRPVYVDPRINDVLPAKYARVPQGLFLRLYESGRTAEWKPLNVDLVEGTFQSEVTSDLKRYYAGMFTYHAYWLLTQNRTREAVENIQRALSADPSFVPALNLRARLAGQGH